MPYETYTFFRDYLTAGRPEAPPAPDQLDVRAA